MNKQTEIKLTAEEIEGTQATFSTWLVAVGDAVKEGDPIAELETDKVAMEVCATQSGFIQSIKTTPGEKVEAEQVLGFISEKNPSNKVDNANPELVISADQLSSKQATNIQVQTIQPAKESNKEISKNSVDKNSISPVVRRLLSENGVNINEIEGSGKRGRVTRDDVIKFVKTPKQKELKVSTQTPPLQTTKSHELLRENKKQATLKSNMTSQLIPHSNMRKSIASHMVNSLLETSPHVTSVFEMDMQNIIEHRKWHKKEYNELGIKLTFTAYFLIAMAKAVKKVPQVNAKFHDDALEIFSDINIGVGTALAGSDQEDSGLVVPVVQQVQTLSLFQVAKTLHKQTEKARTNQLKPSDMKNGTLTISNHGVSGSLFATPIIINQPQVAILGVGKLEKRVVVEEINGKDEMVIRPKCYVSLSIDHRALDAHQTNSFLSEFVKEIEHWGE